MNRDHTPRPHSRTTGGWRATRRDFLRAVGLGGATALATGARRGSASGEEPPGTEPGDDTEAGWRQPGGPTVEQLSAELGHDPERIFRFVSDEIQYDPYVGVLRGAKGTLWSRAGNSVDQAVLLAALLNEAGVETRFAVGSLDEDAATAVRDAAIVDEATLRGRLAPVIAFGREPTAEELDVAAAPENEEFIAQLPERSEQVVAAAREQLDAAAATITGALREAGIELPPAVFEVPERERAEHVWLQYAAGAEWVDLDPTIPAAAAGNTLVADGATTDALPNDLRHAVTVTIVAEFINNERPSHRDLISLQFFTEDLVGLPISIGHAKPEGLAGLGASIAGALDGSVPYIPIIVVGDTAEGPDEWIKFFPGGGIVDLFGNAITEGDTLAEWVEITVTSPDAPPQTAVREIFDRVGYVRRATGDIDLAAIDPVELVDINDEATQEYLPLRAVWSLAVTGAGVPLDFFDQDPAIDDFLADLALLSEGQSLVRDALYADAAAASGHRYLTDRPNVTAFVAGPVEVTDIGPRIETSFDLLTRGAAAVPLAGGMPGDTHPGVVAGVLSHVAERVCGGDWEGNENRSDDAISVGRVFEQAAADGVAVRVVTPEVDDVDDLAISDQAHVRLAAAIDAGLIVIVPERAVQIGDREITGWWLIDPLTGAAIDQLEDGRGSEFGDYLVTLQTSFRTWGGFRRLGQCVVLFGPVILAVAALSLAESPGAVGLAFGGSVIGGINLFLKATQPGPTECFVVNPFLPSG